MTDFHALIHSYQNCACGQVHTCAIRDIEIGSGLVRSVGDILRKNGFGPRLLLAADEQTLAAAEGIDGLDGAAVFSVGSDGTDGPTDAAGGYTDGSTAQTLREQGISISQTLRDNDAYHALEACGGLIITGPTGTNVNDVAVALLRP